MTRSLGRICVMSSPSSRIRPDWGPEQPHRGPQQGRLAGTVVAHDSGDPLRGYFDGHTVLQHQISSVTAQVTALPR